MKSGVLALTVLAACSSQVDGDHRGQPLAQLSGSVENSRLNPTAATEVAAVWEVTSGSPDFVGGEAVEVTGNFPAQFELAIYVPPDAILLNSWNGVQVGVAYILAAPAGTDYTDGEGLAENMLGMDIDHLLVYVPADVPADSFASYKLRGTPKAGFHLYGVKRLGDEERAARQACIEDLPSEPRDEAEKAMYTQCGGDYFHDDMLPLEADLDTLLHIDLVDDPSSIDFPNWN